jgi:glycopeptide antibiotics resistance protein
MNRKKVLILLALYVVFIFYAALIPFNLSLDLESFLNRIQSIQWIPLWNMKYQRPESIPDIVQNVIFFMPLGFLGYLVFHSLFKILSMGLLLTCSVEFLQLLTHDRTTSATDIMTNFTGTVFGCVFAVVGAHLVHHFGKTPRLMSLFKQESFPPFCLFMGLTGFSAIEPFDFTLDVGIVLGNVKSLMQEFVHPSLQLKDELLTALQYGALSLFASQFFTHQRFRHSLLMAFFFCSFWGIFLEMSQLIVSSRTASFLDIQFPIAGSALGIAGFRLYQKKNQRTLLFFIYAILFFGASAINTMSPFVLRDSFRYPSLMPFRYYYNSLFFHAVSNILSSILIFFPLGFFLQCLQLKKTTFIGLVVLVVVYQWILEFGQGWIEGRYSDITDFFLFWIGLLTGYWVSRILRERLKSPRFFHVHKGNV